jgi:hypothetical protein
MVDGIVAMGTALMKLKDVRDVNDALDVVDGVQDGKQKYDNGVSAVKSGAISAAWNGYKLHGAVKATNRPDPNAAAAGPSSGASGAGGASNSGGGQQ